MINIQLHEYSGDFWGQKFTIDEDKTERRCAKSNPKQMLHMIQKSICIRKKPNPVTATISPKQESLPLRYASSDEKFLLKSEGQLNLSHPHIEVAVKAAVDLRAIEGLPSRQR